MPKCCQNKEVAKDPSNMVNFLKSTSFEAKKRAEVKIKPAMLHFIFNLLSISSRSKVSMATPIKIEIAASICLKERTSPRKMYPKK